MERIIKPFQIVTILLVCNLLPLPLQATSIEVGDTLSGSAVWDVDTVRVISDLLIPDKDTLTIMPGTRVEFQGHYSFINEGRLIADGAPSDSIVFTINDTTGFSDLQVDTGGWNYIDLGYNGSTSYCIFEYAKTHSSNQPVVRFNLDDWYSNSSAYYCSFQHLYSPLSAVYVWGGLSSCTIKNNYCTGIISNWYIINCLILNNSGDGVRIYGGGKHEEWESGSALTIGGNTIKNNRGYGITEVEPNPVSTIISITSNVIRNNGGGIHLKHYSCYIIRNFITENKHFETLDIVNGNLCDNLIAKNVLDQNTEDSSSAIIRCNNVSFINNTVTSNINTISNTTIHLASGTIENNILWENTNKNPSFQINAISSDTVPPNLTLNNCDIQSGIAAVNVQNVNLNLNNNLDADPLFVDKPNGKYQLSPNSPCIDNGFNTKFYSYPMDYPYPPFPYPLDILGKYRIFPDKEIKIDIGTYEYLPDSILMVTPEWDTVRLEVCRTRYKSIFINSKARDYEASGPVYSWYKNGELMENEHGFGLLFKNPALSDSGTYTFNDTNLASPHNFYSATLVLSFFPQVSINNQSKDIILCPGSDTMLYVSVKSQKLITYSWMKNDETIQDENDSILNLSDISQADTGNYYCIVDDGCTQDTSDLIHLGLYSVPNVQITADTTFCPGDTLTLIADAPSDKVRWNNDTINDTLKISQAGYYFVDVWNEHQCHSSDTIKVQQYIPKQVHLGNDTTLCPGQIYKASAGEFTSYLWSDGSDSSSTVTDTAATIWVKVTDENNCASSDTVNVYNYNSRLVHLGNDTTLCPGQTYIAHAGNFVSYLWSDGSDSSSTVTDTAATIWVKVTDENNCISGDTVSVYNYIPRLVHLGNDTTLCPGQTYIAHAGDFNSYQWSDGSDSSVTETDTVASIWVKVTDENSCVSSDTVNVWYNYPVPTSIAYISNDLSDNHYKVAINPDADQNTQMYELFRGSGNMWGYIDSIPANSGLAFFTDTSSRPDQQPPYYAVQAVNSCLVPSEYSLAHRPLFVHYDLNSQDTLDLNIEPYSGIPATDYYLFAGNSKYDLQPTDTLTTDENDTSFVLTALPYDSTWYCLAIRVNDSTFSYSNMFFKPRKNSAPYDILLSNDEIMEGSPSGTIIGQLTAEDHDATDSHQFELPERKADNAYFRIKGNELLSDSSFDYKTRNSYTLLVRTIDDGPGNLAYEKYFIISVTEIPRTGIDQPVTDNSITVFPNPFNKLTTIQVNGKDAVIRSLKLLNVAGKTVLDISNINKDKYVLYKENITPGTYFVMVRTKTATIKKVVIIQ